MISAAYWEVCLSLPDGKNGTRIRLKPRKQAFPQRSTHLRKAVHIQAMAQRSTGHISHNTYILPTVQCNCVCLHFTVWSLQWRSNPKFLKCDYLVCIFASRILPTADITVFRAAFCRFSWFLETQNKMKSIIGVITTIHYVWTLYIWTVYSIWKATVGGMVKPSFPGWIYSLVRRLPGLKTGAWADPIWLAEFRANFTLRSL